MRSNLYNYKECRIFLDWLLSVDYLTVRDIYNHLIISGFDTPSNLACSYAFFLTEFQKHKNNANIERAIMVLHAMILRQYMEMFDFYPCFDSIGFFGFTSQSAVDFV